MRVHLCLIIIFMNCLPVLANDSVQDLFWKSWEKADYQNAKKYGEIVSKEKPEYLIPLYYIDQIYTEYSYKGVIKQLLQQRHPPLRQVENLNEDCKKSVGENSFLYQYIQALTNSYEKKSWNEYIEKSLTIKPSVDAYLFRYNTLKEHPDEDLQNALKLMPDNYSLRIKKIISKLYHGVEAKDLIEEYNFLVITNTHPMTIDDYRFIGKFFLGTKYANAIGSSGPNGEPYYGKLYNVTNWNLVNKMTPIHKLFFSCAVGYGGFQNSVDSEAILKNVPKELKDKYSDQIYLLKIFNYYHDYNYDAILKTANEIAKNKGLSSRMIYNDYYDMAYQLEMQGLKYNIKKSIEASTILYQKSFENIPDWASSSKTYIAYEWGRALYYCGKYKESINRMEANVDLTATPIATMLLSLSYYSLDDKVNGKKYENMFYKTYENNPEMVENYKSELLKISNKGK